MIEELEKELELSEDEIKEQMAAELGEAQIDAVILSEEAGSDSQAVESLPTELASTQVKSIIESVLFASSHLSKC